jgi:hypothetical protein
MIENENLHNEHELNLNTQCLENNGNQFHVFLQNQERPMEHRLPPTN